MIGVILNLGQQCEIEQNSIYLIANQVGLSCAIKKSTENLRIQLSGFSRNRRVKHNQRFVLILYFHQRNTRSMNDNHLPRKIISCKFIRCFRLGKSGRVRTTCEDLKGRMTVREISGCSCLKQDSIAAASETLKQFLTHRWNDSTNDRYLCFLCSFNTKRNLSIIEHLGFNLFTICATERACLTKRA